MYRVFRKYMIDSLLYWAKEYHIDGFRFDLMAIHDTETMNAIRRALDGAGLSNVILYGEPWYATNNDSELAPGYLASNKKNAHALDDRIAMFNSYTRTGIIGGLDGSADGFVQGGVPAVTGLAAEGTSDSLMSAIAASSNQSWERKAHLHGREIRLSPCPTHPAMMTVHCMTGCSIPSMEHRLIRMSTADGMKCW